MSARHPFGRVRQICLALPGVEEKKAWGAPTFRSKNKMFAMFADNHHGDGRTALWLNAEEGVQEVLVEADPRRFFIPPYQGPQGWIGVILDETVDWDEVAELVEEAHRVTTAKPWRAAIKNKK